MADGGDEKVADVLSGWVDESQRRNSVTSSNGGGPGSAAPARRAPRGGAPTGADHSARAVYEQHGRGGGGRAGRGDLDDAAAAAADDDDDDDDGNGRHGDRQRPAPADELVAWRSYADPFEHSAALQGTV